MYCEHDCRDACRTQRDDSTGPAEYHHCAGGVERNADRVINQRGAVSKNPLKGEDYRCQRPVEERSEFRSPVAFGKKPPYVRHSMNPRALYYHRNVIERKAVEKTCQRRGYRESRSDNRPVAQKRLPSEILTAIHGSERISLIRVLRIQQCRGLNNRAHEQTGTAINVTWLWPLPSACLSPGCQ